MPQNFYYFILFINYACMAIKIGISVSPTNCNLRAFVNHSPQGVVCMNSLFSLVRGHLILIWGCFLGTIFIFLLPYVDLMWHFSCIWYEAQPYNKEMRFSPHPFGETGIHPINNPSLDKHAARTREERGDVGVIKQLSCDKVPVEWNQYLWDIVPINNSKPMQGHHKDAEKKTQTGQNRMIWLTDFWDLSGKLRSTVSRFSKGVSVIYWLFMPLWLQSCLWYRNQNFGSDHNWAFSSKECSCSCCAPSHEAHLNAVLRLSSLCK